MIFVISSIVLSILSILFVPFFLGTIPADYLNNKPKRNTNIFKIIARNIFGIFLIAIGIVLLLLPGQGLLTMVAGLLLIDYPCKYKIEKNFFSKPKVFKAINWARQKIKKPPLQPLK